MHVVIFAHACPLASIFCGMPKRYCITIFYEGYQEFSCSESVVCLP